jgi:hypothetical protein
MPNNEAKVPRILTTEERAEIENALDEVKATQTAFWNALGDLESLLGGNGVLSSESDYEGHDVDTILALVEDEEEPNAE